MKIVNYIQLIAFYALLPWVLVGYWCVLPTSVQAQTDTSSTDYPPINENLFVNTKWKYTYTTHAESNMIIHKADEEYDYYLYFKYDYSYQMYLNGKLSSSLWELNAAKNELKYNFRNIKWWRIASFTEESLILEFSMNRKSSYRYHFVRVSSEEAPFVQSPNDLPDIDVSFSEQDEKTESEYYLDYLKKRGIKYNAKRWERRKKRRQRRKERRRKRLEKTEKGRQKLKEEAPKELLQIELVGGGFYGGVDPVYRNMTVIKTDGRIIREYKTELQGLRVFKHSITRETLEKLVAYIEEKDFFNFDKVYKCKSPACQQRIENEPRPIPLRVAVTKGPRRHIITVPLWSGRGHKKSLIDYPKELDAIVQAIENVMVSAQ